MPEKITEKQDMDAGLALVLLLLLFVLLGGKQFLLYPAVFCLLLVMTVPAVFSFWARLWFGLSSRLGTVVSKILLTVVFILVAMPIGILRRIGGADPMRIKLWKKGRESVFVERNHLMKKMDIEHPY
jgi:hypothetical protein